VTIFGATSGVGQLVSKKCLENNVKVNAVTRDVNLAKRFDNNLEGCRFFRADGRDSASLRQEGLFAADAVVISVGTTAFPSAKWEGDKNTPKVACLDVVKNILDAMEQSPASPRPRRVILLSSIGVERASSFPFKILNSYGVLQYKLESERLLLDRAKKNRYEAVVVRPGRLVGAPFTNSDLAKLLQLDQGSNKGITVSANDDVAGDMERGDVATAVVRLLDLELPKSAMGSTVVSIVNKPGRAPTMSEWDALLTAPSAYYDPILL
jgi:nucleoside-diphosphate-sugar epimerase